MTAPVIETPVAADPAPSPGRRFSDDVGTHTRVLARLREYALEDSAELPLLDGVFDDLESVLGEHADLTASEITELTPRLHSAFRRIVGMAVQSNGGVPPDTNRMCQHRPPCLSVDALEAVHVVAQSGPGSGRGQTDGRSANRRFGPGSSGGAHPLPEIGGSAPSGS
ncbi:hypothetical protein [Streptomyces sp. NPDC020681]|uniref:hypothetical protein n=1 Tax=Streptomyces sp. NPDC020681 TaxID=3365083 RepID=UPI0037AB1E0E